MAKMRKVEYFRCWEGGTWDTDIIEIPVDTPEACVDAAITEASNRRNGEHPCSSAFTTTTRTRAETRKRMTRKTPTTVSSPSVHRFPPTAIGSGRP